MMEMSTKLPGLHEVDAGAGVEEHPPIDDDAPVPG
jgi:hypothetical protein